MKKIYSPFLATILILLPLELLAASKITACDPCGITGRDYAAKSVFNWNQGGTVYVVDFYNRTGHKYNVYIEYIVEGPDSFPVHKANELALNPLELEAINDILDLYDALKTAVQSNISSSNIKTKKSILNNASSSSSPLNLGTITIIHPQNSAHDFISNSQLRNELYDAHIRMNLFNIAPVVNKITDTLSLGALNLKDLKLGYKLVFPDGSSVLVVPDLTNETLVIHEGSAKDADNNTIPTNRNSIAGTYSFSNYNGYSSMRQYLENIFGVTGLTDRMCRSYVMNCTFNGSTLTCSVPTCQY